jgi:hypothetical protein
VRFLSINVGGFWLPAGNKNLVSMQTLEHCYRRVRGLLFLCAAYLFCAPLAAVFYPIRFSITTCGTPPHPAHARLAPELGNVSPPPRLAVRTGGFEPAAFPRL